MAHHNQLVYDSLDTYSGQLEYSFTYADIKDVNVTQSPTAILIHLTTQEEIIVVDLEQIPKIVDYSFISNPKRYGSTHCMLCQEKLEKNARKICELNGIYLQAHHNCLKKLANDLIKFYETSEHIVARNL